MSQTSIQNTNRNQIPLDQKIAFGIGMLANQMFPAALGIFMVILVQALGMSPILWALIFFIPKLIDAITDPLMGYISDHTVSPWGKRRPYVFIGAIISGLSFMMMWQLSADNSQMYNFYYFLSRSSYKTWFYVIFRIELLTRIIVSFPMTIVVMDNVAIFFYFIIK